VSANIHPTAVVHPRAEIGDGVVIGPHVVIEDDVIIGEGTEIGNGAHIARGSRLGKDVKVFPYAVIGTIPQDLKFGGEETLLEIGDRTVIREFTTLNRGTEASGRTVVGSDCLLMAYTHVAHDCFVGDHCILANAATLAGHVTVEEWVIVGGLVPIHQFVRIGCHAMVGGGWRVPKDVPPYVIAAGNPLKPRNINIIGLRRRGFGDETVSKLKRAFRTLFRSKADMKHSLENLESSGDVCPEVERLIRFIRDSDRGVIM